MLSLKKLNIFRRVFTADPPRLVVEERLFSVGGCHYVALDPADVSVLLLPTYPRSYVMVRSY